jgi:Effector protein
MGKIYFGGPGDYNQRVYTVFDSIMANPAGAGIVSLIRRTEPDLTFVPYDDNDCDATTHAENPADSAPKGVSNKWPVKMDNGEYQGARWFAGHGDSLATRDFDEREAAVRGTGTGKGSDVTIKYTPDIYGKSWCHPDGKYASKSDEVLFHEMVHALRQMQGKYNQIPTGDRFSGYQNEEEFLAITATNVYLSAKGVGNDGLRGGHDGHYALQPPLNTSAGFLADPANRKLMNIYSLVWADAFRGLALVSQARFNPFRELILNR